MPILVNNSWIGIKCIFININNNKKFKKIAEKVLVFFFSVPFEHTMTFFTQNVFFPPNINEKCILYQFKIFYTNIC